MGLGINIKGEIRAKGLFKGALPAEKLLKDIEKFFISHGNDILKKLLRIDRGAKRVTDSVASGWTKTCVFRCHSGELGCRSEIISLNYDAKEYYQTPEDLIFLLKYTPIIPDFGGVPTDFEILRAFIETNQTEKGIYTNSKRYMIVAKK